MKHDRPQVSVVIPTLGRLPFLLATLTDLSHQDFGSWECLVILQSEADLRPLRDLVHHAGLVCRLFRCSEGNASLARNIGLREARAGVVLFLDDDIKIPSRSFLKTHMRHFDDSSLCGVAGQILEPGRTPRSTRHSLSHHPRAGWLYFPYNYDQPCWLTNGCAGNLSVRREWAMAVGGMDAQFEKGAHREESDFCLRLTRRFGKLRYDPEASLVHLGAPQGGCRTWGVNRGVHPVHHVTGEWYFILKNLREGSILWRDLPHHLVQLLLRQIWNRDNRRRPWRAILAAGRSIRGFCGAGKKLREGPKYLGQGFSGNYHEIGLT